jgi:hypothetical protein
MGTCSSKVPGDTVVAYTDDVYIKTKLSLPLQDYLERQQIQKFNEDNIEW